MTFRVLQQDDSSLGYLKATGVLFASEAGFFKQNSAILVQWLSIPKSILRMEAKEMDIETISYVS